MPLAYDENLSIFGKKSYFSWLFPLIDAKRAFFFLCFHELHWTSLIYSPSCVKTQIFSNETNLKKNQFSWQHDKMVYFKLQSFQYYCGKRVTFSEKIFKNRSWENAKHLSFRDFYRIWLSLLLLELRCHQMLQTRWIIL